METNFFLSTDNLDFLSKDFVIKGKVIMVIDGIAIISGLQQVKSVKL